MFLFYLHNMLFWFIVQHHYCYPIKFRLLLTSHSSSSINTSCLGRSDNLLHPSSLPIKGHRWTLIGHQIITGLTSDTNMRPHSNLELCGRKLEDSEEAQASLHPRQSRTQNMLVRRWRSTGMQMLCWGWSGSGVATETLTNMEQSRRWKQEPPRPGGFSSFLPRETMFSVYPSWLRVHLPFSSSGDSFNIPVNISNLKISRVAEGKVRVKVRAAPSAASGWAGWLGLAFPILQSPITLVSTDALEPHVGKRLQLWSFNTKGFNEEDRNQWVWWRTGRVEQRKVNLANPTKSTGGPRPRDCLMMNADEK